MRSTYILLIVATVNCITAKRCGTEWKLLPSTGYEYKVFCNLSTFQESEHTCKKEGGHLASIHNEEENKFVHDLVRPNKSQSFWGARAWIGLTRDQKSDWYWTDGTETDFIKWDIIEPINFSGRNFCTHIYASSPALPWESYWNDDLCMTRIRKFVCKKDQGIQSAEQTRTGKSKVSSRTEMETSTEQTTTSAAKDTRGRKVTLSTKQKRSIRVTTEAVQSAKSTEIAA